MKNTRNGRALCVSRNCSKKKNNKSAGRNIQNMVGNNPEWNFPGGNFPGGIHQGDFDWLEFSGSEFS